MLDLIVEISKYAIFLIIGLIIGRYFPKLMDNIEIVILNAGKHVRNWYRTIKKEDELVANYRDIWDENGNVRVQKIEYIETHILDEEVINFAIQYNIPELIVRCLSDSDITVQKKSLSILDKIGRKIDIRIIIDSNAIPNLINLLGSQDIEIRRTSSSLLLFIGGNGYSHDVVSCFTGEENGDISNQLLNIYYQFLNVRPPKEFIDEETIKPYFNYLTLPKDPYNYLAALVQSAKEGLFTFRQILVADKIDTFKNFLTNGDWDTKVIVSIILREFVIKGEGNLIIDNNFIPIIIQNISNENNEVRELSEKILAILKLS